MKKISFLVLLSLILLVVWCGKDEDDIDVTQTDFEYDVSVCDKYFKLVDCIIENDTETRKNYSKEMIIELKMKIKEIQEDWKQLSEEELVKKCSDKLDMYIEIEDELNSFGCSAK